MNMTPNKVLAGLALVIAVVLVVSGAYVYTNYKIVNGKLVNVDEFAYIDYEQAFVNSYNDSDPNAQIEYAEKLKSLGLDTDKSNLYLAQAFVNKGSLEFEESENADKAISVLNELLVKNPNNAEALSTLGYAYEIKGEFEKAYEYYNLAISNDPENGDLYARRGHAYDLDGQWEEAETDYLKAYELNTNDDSALMNLARLYYRTGDNDRAVDFADKAIDASPNTFVKATAADLIGQISLDVDDNDLALEYFNYAISENADFAGAYEHRAYTYLILAEDKTGADKEAAIKNAEADIATAQSIHKESSFVLVLKGLVSDIRQNSDEAKANYIKALAMVDRDISLGKVEKDTMRDQIDALLEQTK